MSKFVLVGILWCLCLGCKSKNEQPETSDETTPRVLTTIDSTSADRSLPYFFATGTEPFWSLEISDKLIKYKTPVDSVMLPHTNPILAQDSNVKRYDIETTETNMHIQITQMDCTNAMSGKVSPYTVTLEIKKASDSDFQTLEGCGHYNADYRLHDIWVLESLKGQPVTKEDFSKDLPSLEINAAEKSFSGFAGCNRMNGSLFVENEVLRFSHIATTRMLCETSNKESEFLKALRSSTGYSISNNRLTLSNPTGTLLVFRKID